MHYDEEREVRMISCYHGTDQCGFVRFDIARAEPYNVGLHFGSLAAARCRVEYLRSQNPGGQFRILECRLALENPFRIEDVFGHSYGGIFTALQDEAERQSADDGLRGEIATMIDTWLGDEDDPVLSQRGDDYKAYCAILNREVIRFFKALGYDGFVYANEIEDGACAADSYVAFDENQITVVNDCVMVA